MLTMEGSTLRPSTVAFPEQTVRRHDRRLLTWRTALDRAERSRTHAAWTAEQDAYERYKILCENIMCCLEPECLNRSFGDYCDEHQ
jgi:hypothetical protein